jgi:CheY-like chemotaxis protein
VQPNDVASVGRLIARRYLDGAEGPSSLIEITAPSKFEGPTMVSGWIHLPLCSASPSICSSAHPGSIWRLPCLNQTAKERRNVGAWRNGGRMMEHNTILYFSDRANSSDSLLVALAEKGYEVATTDSPIEGVALLYVMHSVAAVVLDQDATERAGFDLAHSLRQIRPWVPVIVLCSDQIDSSMERTDTCVRKDKLASALKYLLTMEPVAS